MIWSSLTAAFFVLGTERHEARRIDNQLRGRSGRQGDPGATQFLVSTEDDLIRRFGGDRMRGAMNLFGWEEDMPLENKMITRTVESAQNKVEGHHFEIRKHLVDYDDVINTHRDVVYNLRHRVLKGEGLRPTILDYVNKELSAIAAAHLQEDVSNWDIEGFQLAIQTVMPIPEKLEDPDAIAEMEIVEIESILREEADSLYDLRTQEFGEETMGTLERAIMLRNIDSEWVEHLTSMDNMRQGIGLQAAGQRDPPGPVQAPVLRNVHWAARPNRDENCPDHFPRGPRPARGPAGKIAKSRSHPCAPVQEWTGSRAKVDHVRR